MKMVKRSMKIQLLLSLILLLHCNVICAESQDSTHASPVFLPVDLGRYSSLIDPQTINMQAEYDSITTILQNKYPWLDEEPPAFDFDHYMLVGDESWADGSASFSYQVLKDTLAQSIEVHIIEHYGGGRGMNVFNHWLLIPKIPEGYSVKFIHTEGEPRHKYEN